MDVNTCKWIFNSKKVAERTNKFDSKSKNNVQSLVLRVTDKPNMLKSWKTIECETRIECETIQGNRVKSKKRKHASENHIHRTKR